MKRFKDINDLHQALERAAKRTIKAYYTDWKNYDRPALMKATGEKEIVYIILRQYGSYLYTKSNLESGYKFAFSVLEYYTTDPTAIYYKADLKNLTLEKIPAGIPAELKEIARAA